MYEELGGHAGMYEELGGQAGMRLDEQLGRNVWVAKALADKHIR